MEISVLCLGYCVKISLIAGGCFLYCLNHLLAICILYYEFLIVLCEKIYHCVFFCPYRIIFL